VRSARRAVEAREASAITPALIVRASRRSHRRTHQLLTVPNPNPQATPGSRRSPQLRPWVPSPAYLPANFTPARDGTHACGYERGWNPTNGAG
jgi:hypothetical protein